MAQTQHCPGFEDHKQLGTMICICTNCKAEIEIFSDEVGKDRKCKKCGTDIDYSKCEA